MSERTEEGHGIDIVVAHERLYKSSIRRILTRTIVGTSLGLLTIAIGSHHLCTSLDALSNIKRERERESSLVNYEVERSDRYQAQIKNLESERNTGIGLGILGLVLTLTSPVYGTRTILRENEKYDLETGN